MQYGTKHVQQVYTIIRTLDILGNPCDSIIFDEDQHNDLREHISDLDLWGVPFEYEELRPL